MQNDSVRSHGEARLLESLSNLRCLDNVVEPDVLLSVSRQLPKLRRLRLLGRQKFQVLSLATLCPNLKELTLHKVSAGCFWNSSPVPISRIEMESVTKLSQLRVLDLQCVLKPSSLHLLAQLRHLHELVLSVEQNLSKQSCVSLGKALSNSTKFLFAGELTLAGLNVLVENTNLTVLRALAADNSQRFQSICAAFDSPRKNPKHLYVLGARSSGLYNGQLLTVPLDRFKPRRLTLCRNALVPDNFSAETLWGRR